MLELEGQDAARLAIVAAWPHMTDKGRRSALRAWLGTEPPPDSSVRTIERGPGLDTFIGARR